MRTGLAAVVVINIYVSSAVLPQTLARYMLPGVSPLKRTLRCVAASVRLYVRAQFDAVMGRVPPPPFSSQLHVLQSAPCGVCAEASCMLGKRATRRRRNMLYSLACMTCWGFIVYETAKCRGGCAHTATLPVERFGELLAAMRSVDFMDWQNTAKVGQCQGASGVRLRAAGGDCSPRAAWRNASKH